ncbi:FCD domain-containing protein [Streptacidiphilus sp. PAMC 29251]
MAVRRRELIGPSRPALADHLIHAGEAGLQHRQLLAAAGNPLLTQFYTSLRDRQVRMVAESVAVDPGRHQSILAEHAAIAEAVRAGELEDALAAVRTHIASTKRALGLV